MNLQSHRRVLLLLFVLGAVSANALAQVPTGAISGWVKDAQGLPIAGATVTLTNQGTASTQTAKTSSLGGFRFSQINFGTYQVEVSDPGFKLSTVNDIKLDASTEYTVPPIVLELGAIQETVTVEAGADEVRTAGAELTDTVENKQIENLPLLDRNPLNLLGLEAGVEQNGRSETVINGQRQSFSNVTLDGINIQDNYIRSESLDYSPNLLLMSQTGEFTVTTQNAGPQAGMGSSQVSIVTPSGTNNWHGEGAWYYRTNAWAANDWFNDKNGVPKPTLLQNQAGGDIGGAIIKDKLFIYGAYELLRLKKQDPTDTTVLTPGARNGTFLFPADCSTTVSPTLPTCPSGVTPGSIQSVNLLTLNGRNVPIDPVIATMLSQVPPAPLNPISGIGDGLNTVGYRFNQRRNDTRDNTSIRVDWNPAAHHSFTATYAWNRQVLDEPGSNFGLTDTFSPVPAAYVDDKENFLSVAWRWAPTSHVTNEVRFGFDLAPINFLTNQQLGNYTISGTVFDNPNQNVFPSSRKTHTWSWQDNASWTRGNHTVTFGIQVQRVTIDAINYANTIPNLDLDYTLSGNPNLLSPSDFGNVGISSSSLDTANRLISTLGGLVGSEMQTFNVTSRTSGYVSGAPAEQNFRYNDWSLYVSDSWKLRRNLTLTYGLRWEYNSPFDEKNGLLVFPQVAPGQTIQQTLLSDATLTNFGGDTRNLPYRKQLRNLAPNIGIAWDPFGDGKTSVRAGYSMNYVNDELISAPYNASLSNPGVSTQAGPTFLSGATISNPGLPISVPPMSNTFSGNWANLYSFATGSNFGYAIDPNLKTPYVQQWNLSVQREIGWNTSLTVSYVGNKGSNLYRAIDLNQIQIPPAFLQAFNALRQNGFLSLAATGIFNPYYTGPGSQNVTYFNYPNFLFGDLGQFFPAIVDQYLQQGAVGDLADLYHAEGSDSPALYNVYGISGGPIAQLAPNQYLEAADLLGNFASSIYHAGSVEIRRRFRQGLTFQASYTFSKVFTNYSADTNAGSQRFSPLLDNANPGLEWARADFDLTHAFKANFVYELPVGRGHMWSPTNKELNQLVSGWTVSSIITWQSGPPFSILSGEGTLNRTGRSIGLNTASTTSSVQQIAGQLGVQNGPNGTVALINPAFIGPDGRGVPNDALTCAPLIPGGFCNPAPGTVGNLPRNAFNGPAFFNLDLGIHKAFQISESTKLEYRMEMFNALNHPTFAVGDSTYAVSNPGASQSDMYINDPNFGVATRTTSNPRVIQMGLSFIF